MWRMEKYDEARMLSEVSAERRVSKEGIGGGLERLRGRLGAFVSTDRVRRGSSTSPISSSNSSNLHPRHNLSLTQRRSRNHGQLSRFHLRHRAGQVSLPVLLRVCACSCSTQSFASHG